MAYQREAKEILEKIRASESKLSKLSGFIHLIEIYSNLRGHFLDLDQFLKSMGATDEELDGLKNIKIKKEGRKVK